MDSGNFIAFRTFPGCLIIVGHFRLNRGRKGGKIFHFTVVSMVFYNLLCCTRLSIADADVVQFHSCLNRCCRGLC